MNNPKILEGNADNCLWNSGSPAVRGLDTFRNKKRQLAKRIAGSNKVVEEKGCMRLKVFRPPKRGSLEALGIRDAEQFEAVRSGFASN